MFIYNALSKREKRKRKKNPDIIEDNVPFVAPLLESPDKLRLQEDPVSRKLSSGPSATKEKSLQMLPYEVENILGIFQNVIYNVRKIDYPYGKKVSGYILYILIHRFYYGLFQQNFSLTQGHMF